MAKAPQISVLCIGATAMSENGEGKPISVVHNPDWGNGEVDRYEEYETYYLLGPVDVHFRRITVATMAMNAL